MRGRLRSPSGRLREHPSRPLSVSPLGFPIPALLTVLFRLLRSRCRPKRWRTRWVKSGRRWGSADAIRRRSGGASGYWPFSIPQRRLYRAVVEALAYEVSPQRLLGYVRSVLERMAAEAASEVGAECRGDAVTCRILPGWSAGVAGVAVGGDRGDG
jgi:hypothetical protein